MLVNKESEITLSIQHFALTPEQRKQRHDLLSAVNHLSALTRALQSEEIIGTVDFRTKELLNVSQHSLAKLRQFVEHSFTSIKH